MMHVAYWYRLVLCWLQRNACHGIGVVDIPWNSPCRIQLCRNKRANISHMDFNVKAILLSVALTKSENGQSYEYLYRTHPRKL
jgi:hypothetical protein